MEAVLAGNQLQKVRTAFLDELLSRQNVLFLGEGNGRLLIPFLKGNATAKVSCLDASSGMLDAARRRLACAGLDTNRVDWIHRDVTASAVPQGSFDAVVTCFFLDCFEGDELRHVVRSIAGAAAEGAIWVVADFGVPKSGLARLRARIITGLMYPFFRAITGVSARHIEPIDTYFEAAGFSLIALNTWSAGLLHADLWRNGLDSK
jgi:ubiquinone/menaquinone biosynthesis C-methylase UbiE